MYSMATETQIEICAPGTVKQKLYFSFFSWWGCSDWDSNPINVRPQYYIRLIELDKTMKKQPPK